MKRAIFITFTAKSDGVKLEKYIKQLLLENEMVIVPGFGAFISEYIPAAIDDTSGEIKPPSSKLAFNSKIKNNDGLLVGQVAEATRCTHFEALQKIEKERDNIIYQLDKEEKVELDELGILSYNDEKQVVLVSLENANLSLENFGLESTKIETPEKEELSEEPEMVTVPTEEEVSDENEDSSVVSDEEETIVEPDEEPEESTVEEDTEEETTRIIVQEPVFFIPPEKKKKRIGGWVWLLVILVPLLAVSVFIYMKQNKAKEPVRAVQQKVEKTIVPDSISEQETPAIDSLESQNADTLTAKEHVQNVAAEVETGKYYLVGGSFKEEENAETYLQTLKEKGFDPFHMGKYGNYFIVGIGHYNTENEAIIARDEYLEQNPGSGVWILKR